MFKCYTLLKTREQLKCDLHFDGIPNTSRKTLLTLGWAFKMSQNCCSTKHIDDRVSDHKEIHSCQQTHQLSYITN